MPLDKKYNILFVDDERRILTALRSIFRRKYNVFLANSGLEALEILGTQSINVIVSDQRMPNMLGHELLSKVHKHHPETMRLLLTGFMDKEAIIETINEGEIYRFINKPWNNDEIYKIIAEAALASEFALNTSQHPQSNTQEPVLTTINQPTTPMVDQAILMMGSNQELRNQIRYLCRQNDISIYSTQSIPQAIEVVAAKPTIGVTIIELPVDTDGAIQTISLLKEKRPELISIILADETDAETAVALINSGQVFRYLTKPLQTDKLKKTIEQAFIRHNILKENTHMHQRYKVEKPKSKLAAGLKELFSSFGLIKKTG